MQIRAKRSLIAAALVAAIAAPALAQGWMMQGGQGPGMMQGMGPGMMQGGPGGWGPMMGMSRMMMGDPAQHMSGRLAFIEAELDITDEQRPLWDAFAQAVRDAAGSMSSMHERMMAIESPPALPERLALMEEAMSAHLAALRTVRDEATALYEALSPSQQKTADSVMGMGMM